MNKWEQIISEKPSPDLKNKILNQMHNSKQQTQNFAYWKLLLPTGLLSLIAVLISKKQENIEPVLFSHEDDIWLQEETAFDIANNDWIEELETINELDLLEEDWVNEDEV